MSKHSKKRKIVSKSEAQRKKYDSQEGVANGRFPNGQHKEEEDNSVTSPSKRSLTHIYLACITFIVITFFLSLIAFHNLLNVENVEFDDAYMFNIEQDEVLKRYKQIERMDKIHRRANLGLQEFKAVYDGKWPVLITDVMQEWPASNWTKEFFVNVYGEERITMKAVRGTLKSAESFALPLKLFLSHVHEGQPNTWTYLEDEIFLEQRPQLKKDLIKPVYLEEDLFQNFPSEIRPWNAMLLWGTRYSRSSLHIDPYNWTGTNAVFKGLKKWKLYPPGQDQYLYVYPDQLSGFPLSCYKYNSPVDAFNPDLKTYPMFRHAKAIEFDQKPGELLIIPTGWFHQAYNDDETMAVSSQVMNSGNYEIVIEEILKANEVLKDKLPQTFYDMTPVQKVNTLMRLMPKDILDRGREVNAEALNEIHKGTR
ncbi:F-box protein At1g78280-like [Anneissia japonica]|uniref:F-box protein At1g78280-like n=1 Tax=Anneissia japonica TaxID=1529436 RepID=UPI0014254D9A|nr:F-box protein At1g78280-like [Anneissia japonica]XP_033118155.1 F-box protein At1g78280-like [Anneissia japonica]